MANIFIYGSCVSRDTYEYHLKHHKLLKYMARQSWISATTPPSSFAINPEPLHNFQKRVVEEDISSNLLPSLRENRDDIDLLLMDLVDERLGVLHLHDGGFVTKSEELMKTKPQEILKNSRHVEFASTEAFDLWKKSALSLKQHFDSLGLTQKTLLIITPFAYYNERGEPTVRSTYFSMTIDEANQRMSNMGDYAHSLGFTIARMPQEYAIADSQHQWGESPVHYHDNAMQWIAQEVERSLAQL